MRAYRTGARFDTLAWARKASFFCMVSSSRLLLSCTELIKVCRGR